MALAKRHKRHKKHEDHVDESWLVPYADILTLLLALFIVLFASSTVDQQKLQQMSDVFNNIFSGGEGVMENSSPTQNNGTSSNSGSQYAEDQASLQEIQTRVEDFIAVNELENQFDTSMTDEGLLITIRDSILFDSGKADIKKEYLPIATQLAEVLKLDPARNVIVTGHTDNVPMNSPEFRSNWELSVMRAVNFLKILIDGNPELDSKYFSVKGYGEYNPIDTNDTAEGRAKNRRVEVLIQPRVSEDGSAYSNDLE